MLTVRYYPFEAGRTLYPVSFNLGYLDKSHVHVYTGDDPNTQLDYTWINDAQISLNEPVQGGLELKIRRIVPHSLFNDYENNARLSEKNLDSSFLQALMIIEEVRDGFISYEDATLLLQNNVVTKGLLETEGGLLATGESTFNGSVNMNTNLNMNTNRVINMGTPQNNKDATTKEFVETILSSAIAGVIAGVNPRITPLKEGPVQVSTLTGGVFEFTTIEYMPNNNEILVYVNGTEIVAGQDYTETNATSITLLGEFNPTDVIWVRNNALVPTSYLKSSDITYTGSAPSVKLALDELYSKINTNMVVTLEQFDSFAGTGGDDTVAFQAACDESFTTGKPIQLLAKTYKLTPKPINTPGYRIKSALRGLGAASRIECIDTSYLAADFILLPFDFLEDVVLEDFHYDCLVTADPTDWQDNFILAFNGARGINVFNSDRVQVNRIVGSNVYRATVGFFDVRDSEINFCYAHRNRGGSGDGFIVNGKNVEVNNCVSYDFTRIGFVVETGAGQPYLSTNINFNHCHAEYGHDQSINHGGTEFNAGFWLENYTHGGCYDCRAISTGDRGFTSAISYSSRFTKDPMFTNVFYNPTVFENCFVDNTNYGFVVNSLEASFRSATTIKNCVGENQRIFVFVSGYADDRQQVSVENSHCSQTTAFNTNSFLMHLGGSVSIKDCSIKYFMFDQALWDSTSSPYAVLNEFSTDAGHNIEVDNLRAFDASDNQIAIKFKFKNANSRSRRNLTINNCMIEQVETFAKTANYTNCTFTRIGSTIADTTYYTKCTILDTFTFSDPLARFPVITNSATNLIVMDNCLCDFTVSGGYLYLYCGGDRGEQPNVVLNNVTFKKNFATSDYAVRLNAVTSLKAIPNVHNFEMNNCKFINTGGSTSNGIVKSDYSVESLAKVYGTGNYKSSNLSTSSTGSVTMNWNVKNFGAA